MTDSTLPGETWGSDTPISMPEIPKHPPLVNMGGFAFTEHGIVHALTEADRQTMLFPAYGPEIQGAPLGD